MKIHWAVAAPENGSIRAALMKRLRRGIAAVALGAAAAFPVLGQTPDSRPVGGASPRALPVADLLLEGGRLIDGAGGAWVWADVAVTGSRITFVGRAADARIRAKDTVDVTGLLVAPGFRDARNHENLTRKLPVG